MSSCKQNWVSATWVRWRLPIVIATVAIVIQLGGWHAALRYDVACLQHGQWWRLLTANLVHLGWVHLWRDLSALFIIWFGFSRCLSERGWLTLFVLNGMIVTTGLYWFVPTLQWYVGLSGILYGWVVCAGLLTWPTRPWLGTIMVFGTIALVLYDLLIGPLPGQALGLGGRVIPQAHLFGMIGSGVFVMLRSLYLLIWVAPTHTCKIV